jgi:AraC family transcriptional regulator of adaptative response / DNA-3-methyladenine glycosylase II
VEFSAVRTTGIYCRPGCAARPHADNVRTFELAAAAEAAGYRACLRCRPYRVAGSMPWAAPEIVCRAVQLIIGGALDDGGEEHLGRRLGISARHLRRLFHQHLGVTPDQFARSRRAHFARRLLDDTDLSITDIAFASGFSSLRQFNRTMTETFRASPSELRAQRRRSDRLVTDGGLLLRMPFSAPYDWHAVVKLLAERAVPGIESVSDGVYRRTVSLDGAPGVVEVCAGGSNYLVLRAHLPYWEGLIHVVERVAGIVGLAEDMVEGVRVLGTDPAIGHLVAARPGLRVPGAWSGLEAAVAAMAGDGVAAIVQQFGVPVAGLGHDLTHLFPSAETLADSGPATVQALARAVAEGGVVLDRATEPADLLGVAPEAASEIALRLGYRDALPMNDSRLRRVFETLGISLADAATAWRPWRGLAAIHLIGHAICASSEAA